VLSKTPADFDSVARAISGVNVRLGLTGRPLEEISLQVVRLSRITKTDLATNLDAITPLFNQWGVKGAQASDTLDMLFRASQRSGVSVATLAQGLTRGGVAFRAVGFSMRDATAALALLGRAGLGVNDIMPAVARGMAKAGKAGQDAATYFRSTFESIRTASSDVDASGIALDAFGARAGPRLSALIRQGKLSYEQFSAAIAKGDSIEKAASDVGTYSGKLGTLKNQLKVALEPVAIKVFGSLGDAVAAVAPLLTTLAVAFGGLVTAVAAVPSPILATVGGIAVFGLTAGKLIAVGTKLVGTFKTLGTALMALGKFAMANPWVLLIAATVLLAVIIVKNWDKIKAALAAVWNWIKPAVTAVKNVMVGAWQLIVRLVTGYVNVYRTVITTVFGAIRTVVTGAVNVVRSVITTAWQVIATVFRTYVNVWRTIFATAWNAIRAVVSAVTGAVRAVLSGWVSIISGIINRAKSIIGGIAEKFQWVSGIVTGVAGAIRDGISSMVDAVIGTIQRLINFVRDNASKILGPLGKVAGFVGGAISRIPGFAAGGRPPVNRPVLVGERGPELVQFHSPARVYTAQQTAQIMGELQPAAAQGTSVTVGTLVEFSGPISVRSDDDVTRLSRDLAREAALRLRSLGTAQSTLAGASA
jgi:phage-related minor tail protein